MNEINGQKASGLEPNGTALPQKPDNALVLAIIATVTGLCTCIGLVIGIIAIVYATQVDNKYTEGDYVQAEVAAKVAKILALIALIFNVVIIVVSIIYWLVAGATIMQMMSQQGLM